MKKLIVGFVMLAVMLSGCKKDEELTESEQLEKDVATIDKYLSDKAVTAQTDPSGLRLVITTAGTGATPALTNTVTVSYVGKFLDSGEIFDQSAKPLTYPLSGFIKGWQIGFQLLPKGSKATLYIPSGLGYGKEGYPGSIPPNANLVFDVELIDFK